MRCRSRNAASRSGWELLGRFLLPRDLAPGEELLVPILVHMPADTEKSELRIDLVQKGVIEFDRVRTFRPGESAIYQTAPRAGVPADASQLDIQLLSSIPNMSFTNCVLELKLRVVNRIDHDIGLFLDQPAELHWCLRASDSHEIARKGKRELASVIAPGEKVDLRVNPRLPEIPGQYQFSAFLLTSQHGRDPDLPLQVIDVGSWPIDLLAFDELAAGRVQLLSAPPSMCPGMQIAIPVEISNRSGFRWAQHGTPRVSVLTEVDGRTRRRTDLVNDLPPGETIVQYAVLTAPDVPGQFTALVTVAFGPDRFNRAPGFEAVHTAINVLDPNAGSEFAAREVSRFNSAVAALMYPHWQRRYETVPEPEIARARSAMSCWLHQPVITVALPTKSATLDTFRGALESVTEQFYPNWELCLLVDPVTLPEVRNAAFRAARADQRIQVVPAAARSGRSATLSQAHGEFWMHLADRDRLAPYALMFIADEIRRDPEICWLYWDCEFDGSERVSPTFRCPPNFDLELSTGFMSENACWRRRDVMELGDFDFAANEAELFRVGLRLLESCDRRNIRYIPHLLTRRNGASERGREEARVRILAEHLRSRGVDAGWELLDARETCRIRYPLPLPRPRVSIVIASRDRLDLLQPCIESLQLTTYPNFEIIVVDNGSHDPEVLKYLESQVSSGIITVIRDDGPFNWSALNNLGARSGSGDVLCLLNNDTEVLTPDWLDEMVSQAVRPEVGIVGAALQYPDGGVQHAGIVMDWTPSRAQIGPFHAFKGRDWAHPRLHVVQNVLAVTGACMVVRRAVFETVGGLDATNLAIAYNDVDLCLRIAEQNLRVVWTPFARFIHKESASRTDFASETQVQRAQERSYFGARWYDAAADDPGASPVVYGEGAPPLAVVPRATARSTFRRQYSPRLAFVHIPKTAGLSLRLALNHEYPGDRLLILSARSILGCYDGDRLQLEIARRRARRADVLLGHISAGYAQIVGVPAVEATILRDPVKRTISHYTHLVTESVSPLADSPLADVPVDVLVRKGVIPGNLMLRRILGQPSEPASWVEIERSERAWGASFCGFGLPSRIWHGEWDALLDAEDVPPDEDESLVARAQEVLAGFAFVGRQEAFQEHLGRLGDALGWTERLAPRRNEGARFLSSPTPRALQVIAEYNRLDQLIYDWVAATPDGLLLNTELLESAATAR